MASRKAEKEAAKQRRLEQEARLKAEAVRKQRLYILGGLVGAVIVAVVIVVVVAGSGGGSNKASKAGPQQRAAIKSVNTLLAGIPQDGTTLGSSTAPVTMTYFGDLQCPVCADFTKNGSLASLISNEVKQGKVKVVYRSLCTATCNDEGQTEFNTQQADAYSAGLQDKFWQYAELFYHEQGAEGSGYVTSSYLQSLAQQAGVNLAKWKTGEKNPTIVSQVQSDQELAAKDGFSSTPVVVFQGPKGKVQPTEDSASQIFTYAALQKAITQVGGETATAGT